MEHRIKKDEREFIAILRGLWRKDLAKFIERGDIKFPVNQGQGVVIPVEMIRIPQLRFGPIISPVEREYSDDDETSDAIKNHADDIGIGEGDGEEGDDLGPVPIDGDDEGDGDGENRTAGRGRGHDMIEIEVPYSEFFELFREVLELPLIKPKGHKSVKVTDKKYTDIHPVGPESLRHMRRTLKRTIKRQMAEGTYDPQKSEFIPVRDDKRYKASKQIIKPQNSAVIFFMMDVSGSMSREDREVVRYFCALCELWLHFNYHDLEVVRIIHDSEAEEVTKEVFFRTQRGGGTEISTAHQLMLDIIAERFPPSQWNIYPLYFSDGFNLAEDDPKCLALLKDKILPIVNQYTHCEVNANRHWWEDASQDKDIRGKFSPNGNFGQLLVEHFEENDLVVGANLYTKQDVPDAIKEVFGAGR